MGDHDEKIAAGDPLMQQALQALRMYNEARGVKPAEEIERLRLEAEALMTAVSQYQLRALGGPARTLQLQRGLCSRYRRLRILVGLGRR